jgi:hypothetical protein
MGKKKFKREDSKEPISCRECEFNTCDMRQMGKNSFKSQYICKLAHKPLSSNPMILIPEWCPKGYKNIYNL